MNATGSVLTRSHVVRESLLARSHTFHRYSLGDVAKTQTSGLSACEPLRFLTLHRLHSLTRFLSPCSLS